MSQIVDDKPVTNTAGWSNLQIWERLEEVKLQIGWADITGSAKKWWQAFEAENQQRMALVLRLAEELLWRKATITEFFLAYVYSNTDNIQANLHYLDYTRLKEEERRKKEELRQRQEQEQQDKKEEELRQRQEQQLCEQNANSSYRVILTKVPSDRKIAVLKAVRELAGLSLKEAKDLIESVPPIIVCQGVSAETAQRYAQRLIAVGASISLQPEA